MKSSLEDHEPQLHALEADVVALAAKHKDDPNAHVIKKEVDTLGKRWRDLTKALQYKLDAIEREASQVRLSFGRKETGDKEKRQTNRERKGERGRE